MLFITFKNDMEKKNINECYHEKLYNFPFQHCCNSDRNFIWKIIVGKLCYFYSSSTNFSAKLVLQQLMNFCFCLLLDIVPADWWMQTCTFPPVWWIHIFKIVLPAQHGIVIVNVGRIYLTPYETFARVFW